MLLVLWTVARAVRVVLFAVLALCEPAVRWLLSLTALAIFATCAFYGLVSPPGLKFPYLLGVSLGVGCVAASALYEILVRRLEP
jgi:hypothetical protein